MTFGALVATLGLAICTISFRDDFARARDALEGVTEWWMRARQAGPEDRGAIAPKA